MFVFTAFGTASHSILAKDLRLVFCVPFGLAIRADRLLRLSEGVRSLGQKAIGTEHPAAETAIVTHRC